VTKHNVGDRVTQAQFGCGTVTTVNEYHTTIDFDDHGPRIFSTTLVQLAYTTIPAPPRPLKPARKRAARKSN
jgi:hypothetical protein